MDVHSSERSKANSLLLRQQVDLHTSLVTRGHDGSGHCLFG